ncbi:hypothetical protein NPJ88_001010 [Halomonas elongata]|uniref:hypothetical protein n=1 Tax=Halomonas elongata TaxID=2746 RepID=UPI00255B11B9|nr:hypothetical protein [Halomonas elongata]MDL4860905.1 hypothetical protein [Halomonas elongata]
MHKHIDWDDPGVQGVLRFYADHPDDMPEPHVGSIITGLYRGSSVRVRVEARVEDTSIGDVVALIAPDNGRRQQSVGDLELGDTVRLADTDRAMEPNHPHEDEEEQD